MRRRWAGAALAAGLAVLGCRRAETPRTTPPAGDASPAPAGSPQGSLDPLRDPTVLGTVPTTPVAPWTGPGDRPFEIAARTKEEPPGHARRFGTITLPTALRARTLGQYPCRSCHLGRKVVMVDSRTEDAHQNVQPEHPRQTGSRCATCHAADDVETLVLENGGRATLDESYRLCADCHFSQVEDWADGAHGKRLDGWRGRRVVMACPDCHDPHRPAVQPRIPFRAPRIERARSNPP